MEMQANNGSADLTCNGKRRFTGDLGVEKGINRCCLAGQIVRLGLFNSVSRNFSSDRVRANRRMRHLLSLSNQLNYIIFALNIWHDKTRCEASDSSIIDC